MMNERTIVRQPPFDDSWRSRPRCTVESPHDNRRPPLSGSLGAEVRGADLAHLNPSEFETIHRAFLDHHVLAFRDQELRPEDQIEFGRKLGELFVHPIVPHLPDYPEIVPIVNFGKRRTITEVWHSDVSFESRPPMASALLAIDLPPFAGDKPR